MNEIDFRRFINNPIGWCMSAFPFYENDNVFIRHLFPHNRYHLLPLGEELVNALRFIRKTCRSWILTRIFCQMIDRDISSLISAHSPTFGNLFKFAFDDINGGSLTIEMQKGLPNDIEFPYQSANQYFLHFPIADMNTEYANLLSDMVMGERISLEDMCSCYRTNGMHQQYVFIKRKGLITEEPITCQSTGVIYGLYCCGRVIYVGETKENLISSDSQIASHAQGNTTFKEHIRLHDVGVGSSDDCNLFFQKSVFVIILQKATRNQIERDPCILLKWKILWMFVLRTLTCFTDVRPLGCNEN